MVMPLVLSNLVNTVSGNGLFPDDPMPFLDSMLTHKLEHVGLVSTEFLLWYHVINHENAFENDIFKTTLIVQVAI